MLTANGKQLASPELVRIAARHARSVEQVVFRFALEVGMLPLTGTTSPEHMRADLDVLAFQLEPEEIHKVENIAAS